MKRGTWTEQILSPTEDKAVIRWIERLASWGFSAHAACEGDGGGICWTSRW